MKIKRHTAQRIYQIIRRCLAKECELESPFGGEVECDESSFGDRRKGRRGRGAAGKVPVFWPALTQWTRLHSHRP